MSEPGDVERRLSLARQVFSPSSDQRARVRAGIAAQAALCPDDPIPRTPAAPATPATLAQRATPAPSSVMGASSSASKAGARALGLARATLLLGVGFALGYWVAETRGVEHVAPATPPVASASPFAPAVVTTPAPALLAPSTGTPSGGGANDAKPAPPAPLIPPFPSSDEAHAARSSRTLEPTLSRAKPRRAPAAPPARTLSADAFADEVALLQRAERAVRAGNATLARSFVAELEARFPKTALRQERAAILVLAACALEEPDARRAASAFSTSHPGSVYVDRIQALCALDASHATDASHAARAPSDDGLPARGH